MRATSSWSSVARTRLRSGSISSAIGTGRLVRSSRSSATAPRKLARAIDHVELEEAVRQVDGLAHVVDGVADRPIRRHGDEFGLHPAPGRGLRIVQDALQLAALLRWQLLEDFGLFLGRQVFEDVGRVVGFEPADALGDGLRRHLFEDFLAHRIVDFGERRIVEFAAHQLDEGRPQLGVERLDQVAGVGLVQVAGQLPQRRRVAALDAGAHAIEEFRPDRAVLVAEHVGAVMSLVFEHAAWPSHSCEVESGACTPRPSSWQSRMAIASWRLRSTAGLRARP